MFFIVEKQKKKNQLLNDKIFFFTKLLTRRIIQWYAHSYVTSFSTPKHTTQKKKLITLGNKNLTFILPNTP